MGLNMTWDDSTRANEFVPSLEEKFNYTERPMRGVNIGGWLILEPYITPSFFSNYSLSEDIVDEYTLSAKLGENRTKEVLETHYSTFVTEDTFAQIQAVGLDHVRIPYPYWVIDVLPGDTYLPKVAWRYLLRGIEWARKYGLRVKLDLHSVPGNANGWNHSGRQGAIGWLNGTNGEYYGNLTLDYHKQLAAFFAQDRYRNIVTLYGLVNEPNLNVLNKTLVVDWTKQAYDIVRAEGFENYIVYGDGFQGPTAWYDVFNTTEYSGLIVDMHQYMVFDRALIAYTHAAKISYYCNDWATAMAVSTNTALGHGLTMVGEWSQADTDCVTYLNAVGIGARWTGTLNETDAADAILTPLCPGGNCTCVPSTSDPDEYSDEYKVYLLMAAEAQMYAFESNGGWGFMHWTWKTETGAATQWSYERGVAAGVMPKLAYNRTFNCEAADIPTDFTVLGLPENV
ncbi:glycoside hydrolase superfamily [Limtongia smithiae]|uniref:glycoside hydrolase superfamily n=1 Tax=Limtongia smithiae TaxID=1125753 RepID=UPI0034CD058A